MPKLNAQKAKAVEETEVNEGGGFILLDPGVYELQLREVEVKTGAKGPYWAWTFEIPEGEHAEGKRFWENTSLSEDAEWRLKSMFAAFGVSADTDTDDLIGKRIRANIGQETAQQGKVKGKLVNNIESVLPAKDDGASATGGHQPAAAKKDDIPF